MIDGVEILNTAEIADPRGSVRHVWTPAVGELDIGEVYFSTVLPGVVKGWHVHKEMTLRYAVAYGRIMLGLVDAREDSPTKGERQVVWLADSGPDYRIAVIPPGVANGFRSAPDWPGRSVVVNVPDRKHDPEEIVRLHPRNAWPEFPWGDYALAG